jgi:hypothetical protein
MVDTHTPQPLPGSGPAQRPAPRGPCGQARADVDQRCADADRLAQAAAVHQARLRDVKRRLHDAHLRRDADGRVRDRRQLGEAKEDARRAYHDALARADDPAAVQDAAATWLREVDRLNRELERANRRAESVAREVSELERSIPGVELAADAARIAAEAAQVACLEARRTLAACEEDAGRRMAAPSGSDEDRSASHAWASGATAVAPAHAASRPTPRSNGPTPIALLLRGDRQALLGLTLRLAEETGAEAGRLQLLLLELRSAIVSRALEDHALGFRPDHPFWSQFSAETGRQLAATLSQLGYSFDGRGGWRDGRVPGIRELALALTHCGHDPRSLRRPAGQAAIDELWQGTSVLVEEYLASKAPDLALGRLIDLLGPRAARLGELWDMWGRLRPLLLPLGS